MRNYTQDRSRTYVCEVCAAFNQECHVIILGNTNVDMEPQLCLFTPVKHPAWRHVER